MNKKIIIPLLVIALIAVAFGGYLTYSKFQDNQNVNVDSQETDEGNLTTPQTESENKPDEDSPVNDELDGSNNTQETDEGSVRSTENNSGSTATISTLEQSGNTVVVRTVIDGISSGKCTVVFWNGKAKVEKTAPIGLVTSYYTCQGFDIDRNEFSRIGSWKVVLTVNSNGNTFKSQERTIQIR